MDPLARLLDGPRARGAFVLRSLLSPPWSMRIEDGAPLTLVAVTRGSAWLGSCQVLPGDVALARGPLPYVVADAVDRAPQVVIDAQQQCHVQPGNAADVMRFVGVRSWGNDPAGETELLTGTYRSSPEVSRHLLAVLPAVVVLPASPATEPLLEYLAQECARDLPGQEAVLDRLLDLLLIAALRAWLERDGSGWYRASADPVVGAVLALVHERPSEPWTVASLAGAVGVSRAGLAKRFADLVGESPISCLTSWRLSLAAELLTEGATLDAVARKVGYSDGFALSTAFKRVRGVSPSEFRAALS